jgi:hypothetical protein
VLIDFYSRPGRGLVAGEGEQGVDNVDSRCESEMDRGRDVGRLSGLSLSLAICSLGCISGGPRRPPYELLKKRWIGSWYPRSYLPNISTALADLPVMGVRVALARLFSFGSRSCRIGFDPLFEKLPGLAV